MEEFQLDQTIDLFHQTRKIAFYCNTFRNQVGRSLETSLSPSLLQYSIGRDSECLWTGSLLGSRRTSRTTTLIVFVVIESSLNMKNTSAFIPGLALKDNKSNLVHVLFENCIWSKLNGRVDRKAWLHRMIWHNADRHVPSMDCRGSVLIERENHSTTKEKDWLARRLNVRNIRWGMSFDWRD